MQRLHAPKVWMNEFLHSGPTIVGWLSFTPACGVSEKLAVDFKE